MAEGMEAIAELEPAQPLQTEPETEPSPETETPPEQPEVVDEGKPGGADPQAVRARREYQARKQAERANEELRLKLASLEGEVKTLKETRTEKPAERIFTLAELNTALAEGTLKPEVYGQYVEQHYLPAKVKELLQQEKQLEQKAKPEERALQECTEYTKVQPWLNDTRDPRFLEVAAEFNKLTADYGMPETWVTRALAVRNVLGPLDKLKEKAAVKSMSRDATKFHSEVPAGGNATPKSPLAAAPAELVAQWDKLGTSAEDRAIELKHWNDKRAKAAK